MCHDYFDINDANVVCRELGYPKATRYFSNSYHGVASGPIWLDDLACTGTEASLYYCPHGGVGNWCSGYHYIDAGVVCQGIA